MHRSCPNGLQVVYDIIEKKWGLPGLRNSFLIHSVLSSVKFQQ